MRWCFEEQMKARRQRNDEYLRMSCQAERRKSSERDQQVDCTRRVGKNKQAHLKVAAVVALMVEGGAALRLIEEDCS